MRCLMILEEILPLLELFRGNTITSSRISKLSESRYGRDMDTVGGGIL